MIEVFKTNVKDPDLAHRLIDHIKKNFMNYSANFDLEDCDKILRVQCSSGILEPSAVIDLLKGQGIHAEILSDDIS